MFEKLLYAALPVSIMIVIFIFSSQPYEEQDIKPAMNQYVPIDLLEPIVEPVHMTYHGEEISIETRGVDGVIEFLLRKAAHFSIFFLLMMTTFIALKKIVDQRFATLFWISMLITVAYAGFDEFHQSMTPNRTPYIGDVVLDSIGALSAGMVIITFHWKKTS